MADSRINLLTLSTSTASDDFFVTDGSANGTRRLSAFNPTIGGSLTVSAMISAGNQISTTAGLVCQNADVTGGYMTLRGFGNQDTGVVFLGQTANNNYISSNATTIGVTIGNVGITQTVAAGFRVSSTTNSTNTSSGALIVGNGSSGGLGVGGDTFIGGSLTVTGALNGIICNGAGLSLNTAGSASVRFQDTGVSKWWIYKLSADNNLYFRDMANSRMHMTFIPNLSSSTAISYLFSNLIVESAATSTSTATGALVVSGGIGAAGAINAGGTITSINSSGSGLLGMRSSSGNASYIFWSETGVADRGILGFNNGSSTLSYRSFSSSFATGTEVFSITSGGNVTVAGRIRWGNTTYPGYNAYLSEASTDSQLYPAIARNLIGSTGTSYTIANGELGGYCGFEFRVGDIRWFGATGTFTTGQTVTPVESMRLVSAGNLLIGTTTDNGQRLQVNGTATVLSTAASTNASSGALVVSGGVGVGGNLNIGGQLDLNSGTAAAPSLKLNSTNNGIYYTGSNIVRIAANGAEAATFGATAATIVGSFQTAAPTGGTSAPWKLGTVATVTPTSPNRTIEVEINGVTYYLHAKTTNN